jgi:hypothetical protein
VEEYRQISDYSQESIQNSRFANKLGDAVSKLIPKEEDLILNQGSDPYIKPYSESKRRIRNIWQST